MHASFARLIAALLAALIAPAALAQGTVTVYEFHHAGLAHYFRTADPGEAAGIDSGAAGSGWTRTGDDFLAYPASAYPAGAVPVCRFYGSVSPGPNSHFYTASRQECDDLKALQGRTPASQRRWNYEGMAFAIEPAGGATCPAALTPVLRLYNDGFARGEDSNHRYTTSPSEYSRLQSLGWRGEGTVMCAPKQGGAETLANLVPYRPSAWSDRIIVSRTSGATVDSADLLAGEPLYLSWAVSNVGAAPAAGFLITVYLDGVEVDSWYRESPLEAGFYTWVDDASIGALDSGTHTLRIVADSTGAVGESNEGDNEYVKTFTVAPATPAQTGVVYWNVGNQCSSAATIGYKFYDRDNNLVWPSATTHYNVGYGQTQSRGLACVPGAKICIGGSSGSLSWGVGFSGSSGCTDCCYFCDGATHAYNFGCGGTTTPPPCTGTTGTLNIQADIYARIYLNGQYRGQGQAIMVLPAGSYFLSVRRPDGRECYSQTVFVNACRVNEYRNNAYCR